MRRAVVTALAGAVIVTFAAVAAGRPSAGTQGPSAASNAAAGPLTTRSSGTVSLSGTTRVLQVGARPTASQLAAARRKEPNPDFKHREKAPRVRAASPVVADDPIVAVGKRTAAADGFTIFRDTITNVDGHDVAEPTIANDRDVALATGNDFTSLSTDDGSTWTPLNPFDPAVNPGDRDFCCDQVAYSVDRGSHANVLWLLQYDYEIHIEQNALRLRLFRDREDLSDGVASCDWTFEPQLFGLRDGLWFDFNRLSSTNENFFFTTNVKDAKEDDSYAGAMIFRMSLADIDDGNCTVNVRFWFEEGVPYITPVQNAARKMFLAAHLVLAPKGNMLRIYSIGDKQTKLHIDTVDVDDWGFQWDDRTCKTPDGNNPCFRLHAGQMTGFHSGDVIGFMWTAPQEDFPFPYVRVAVFEIKKLKKVTEHQIRSNDFAWTLPAVGVNDRGELGVLLYAMGGTRFPKAQAFIRKDPREWDGIQMHSVISSDQGTEDWGDYAAVRPYRFCKNTFIGTAWRVKQGGPIENHAVWFGPNAADGCPDLAVSAVAALPTSLDGGEGLSVISTTRNIGSGTARESTTRYYLSHDGLRHDIQLSKKVSVPVLGRGGSFTSKAKTSTVPLFASGSFYVLACAADPLIEGEITTQNNCYLGSQTIVITPKKPSKSALVRDISPDFPPQMRRISPSGKLPVRLAIELPSTKSAAASFSLYLSRAPRIGSGAIRLGEADVAAKQTTGRRVLRVRRVLKLPRTLPLGRLHLAACLGRSPVASRCLTARRPLYSVRES